MNWKERAGVSGAEREAERWATKVRRGRGGGWGRAKKMVKKARRAQADAG